MIGQHLEKYDYKYLKDFALDIVNDKYDKREGSIISDAISPSAYQLADFFMKLRYAYLDTSAQFAYGEFLDNIVLEAGLKRFKSTKSIKQGEFEFKENTLKNIPIGSRFSTVNTESIIYKVVEKISDTSYLLECETLGSIGDLYTGDLLPIDYINNLTLARLTDSIKSGRDTEDDESLRQRYFESISNKSFAGNTKYYIDELEKIDGIGAVQVYPIYNGGGTVKCSIVDTNYSPVSDEFLKEVSKIVDPENSNGEKGLGLGLAPIGHKVTIDTATPVLVNISANIEVESGYILDTIKDSIIKEISLYIGSIKNTWGISNEFNEHHVKLYISKITASILKTIGVANVVDVEVNGLSSDLVFTENASTQEIPVLGEVIFNG